MHLKWVGTTNDESSIDLSYSTCIIIMHIKGLQMSIVYVNS